MYIESKWEAGLGSGKGASEHSRDDQIVLRRDSLRKDPALTHDGREFIVLGISNLPHDLTLYDEPPSEPPPRSVKLAWLTWDDLAACNEHPRAREFAAYLRWKRVLCGSDAL